MANGGCSLHLNRARSLISSIHRQGPDLILEDSKQAAELLGCAIALIQSICSSMEPEGPPPLSSSSGDWKVVRAVMEVLVRLGIAPNLSPGVGVAREKQQLSSKGYISAASAIRDHLSAIGMCDSRLSLEEGTPGCTVLFTCVEALVSLIWNEDVNSTQAVQNTEEDITISGLGQVVLESFLWDVMAAYLQLGFGPLCTDSDGYVTLIARKRLNSMVVMLPVPQMVQASFLLLHQTSTKPPVWLESELGKQLSKLVMRNGGVVAVLKELVGHVSEGNVALYDKVAAHLAKVPRSIATVDGYFGAVCPQILPLLLFYCQSMDPKQGNTSRTALRNIHFTALSLVCKLSAIEPGLIERYLLEPLLRPLLSWVSTLINLEHPNEKEECYDPELEGKSLNVTEDELVVCLVQTSTLLTAGYEGSGSLRHVTLKKVKNSASFLLSLHFQLESAMGSSLLLAGGSLLSKGKKASQPLEAITDVVVCPGRNARGKGVAKGFLNKELGVEDASGEASQDQSTISRLQFALSDVAMALVTQPVEDVLPFMASLLFEHDSFALKWPNEGEVLSVLSSKPAHPSSITMYLSRLLLAVENWPLVVSLMGKLLRKILELRQSLTVIEKGTGGSLALSNLLRCMEDFEVLNNQAGSIALEQDTNGAVSLVTELLKDPSVINDGDTLEIVLYMVHNVFSGLRKLKDTDVNDHANRRDASALHDIYSSLGRVCGNTGLEERLKQMSFTLAEECLALSRC